MNSVCIKRIAINFGSRQEDWKKMEEKQKWQEGQTKKWWVESKKMVNLKKNDARNKAMIQY